MSDQLYVRAKALLEQVKYREWRFRFSDNAGVLFVQAEFDATDTLTGQLELQRGRKWYVSPHMTDSEIIQTAFLAIKTAEEHELREEFLFKGQRIFGPHFNLVDLVELDKISRDARQHKELMVNAE